MTITKRMSALLLSLATSPVLATLPPGHGHDPLSWAGRAEIDRAADDDQLSWDGRLHVGDARDRLLLRGEGERHDGETEASELWALASHNIATFWDVQAGLRADTQPGGERYAVIGIEGLAPYFFDSELHAFITPDGDVSLRAHQSSDILVTQRLVLQPRLELEAGLQDEPRQGLGSGLRQSEISLRLRYEIRREFAPYLEWRHERRHGRTADQVRSEGESASDTGLRLGLMLRF